MSDEIKTVEVVDKVEPEIKKKEAPTREQLKEKGWSAAEMDAAEKRGMVAKPEGAKKEEKAPDEAVKAKTEPDKKTTEEAVTKEKTSLPDFTFKTPEQEKAFLDAFGAGTPQRAMYFRMKNERLSRQKAEQERDKLALELQLVRDAEKRANKGEPEEELDADGNPIDPDDKPLTLKQLKAMQKAEMDALNKQKQDLDERSTKASEAMKLQEEYAKATLPDFEETVTLATDLINNLDSITDPLKLSKIKKMVRDLQVTAAQADKYGVDDYTASMIAYELGQLHPKYGQKADKNGEPKADPKANGEPKLTPEQMKRIEENTHRRASSASLPGNQGGKRTVAVDDITVKDVLKMSPEERFKFKKDHPEKMAKLMRG